MEDIVDRLNVGAPSIPAMRDGAEEIMRLRSELAAAKNRISDVQRDAERYRRLRALTEYGEFMVHLYHENAEAQEIDYAYELDQALDDPDLVRLGDNAMRIVKPLPEPPK